MAVLVDYACTTCEGRTEARVPTPPPAVHRCPACGGEARRVWAPVGLLRGPGGTGGTTASTTGPAAGGRRPGTGPAGAPGTGPAGAPLCVANPDVPGLCHMTPSAGRAWVARARGDTRSLERELARQEAAAKVAPPTLGSVVSHHHHSHHSHHDGGGGHHGDHHDPAPGG